MRTLSFDAFTLTTELRHAGRPVHIAPRPLAVLRCLLEHAERRVTVDELRRAGWGSPRTSSASVHTAISTLRRALDGGVLISSKQSGGYRIHVDVKATGPVGDRMAWRLYAAHATGTDDERIATADRLTRAEFERFGA